MSSRCHIHHSHSILLCWCIQNFIILLRIDQILFQNGLSVSVSFSFHVFCSVLSFLFLITTQLVSVFFQYSFQNYTFSVLREICFSKNQTKYIGDWFKNFLSLICFFQYTAQRFSNIPLKYSTFKFTLPLL